ncbi:MAG: hypothetical protein ACK5NN_00120, partial [Sphingomonadaceae bacterium]
MLFFRKAVDRLTDLLRRDDKITYRAFIDARMAPYVVPLLDRLTADNEDSDALHGSLIHWKRAERPPLHIYQGHTSFCRIDGPLQWAGNVDLPLGGLILSPSVTAHLDPFAAGELDKRMQRAIEDTIIDWVREH